MRMWISLSKWIDALNNFIGRMLMWFILAAVLISAGNAVVRKAFQVSSNAYLEIQWYLFAAVFMLGAGYVLQRNGHVRIDFLSNHFSPRLRNWIDVVGIVFFLIPLCLAMIDMAWPLLVNAWTNHEMSSNAGGLVRWPMYALLPLGFGLLLLQGLSELIKRIAFLRGVGEDRLAHSVHACENAAAAPSPAPADEARQP